MVETETVMLTDALAQKSYVSGIQDLISSARNSTSCTKHSIDLEGLFRQPEKNISKIFYTHEPRPLSVKTPSDVVAFAAEDRKANREAICVIENISPNIIEELGSAWDLDPDFFISHAGNPNQESL